MMLDFLFFYEHVNREVENDSLIIHELRSRGYKCELMPFDGPEYWWRYLFRKKAKVLVVPWLRTNTNICHYLHLASKPYKIVDLQWEQVTNQAFRELDVLSTNSLKSFHLCWGENSAKVLMSKGAEEENVPIVGAIQQDYCREQFRDYYYSREQLAHKYNLDDKKRWILYVSSFSFANITEEYLENLKKVYGEYIVESRNLQIDTQRITLEWIKKYISKYDCEFIYRPHPTESTSMIINDLASHNTHFHVISDYSVKQWGLVSDSVNLWVSTSNAELAAMNVSYHYIRPIKISDYREMESMFGETFIVNYEDFERVNNESKEEAMEGLVERKQKLKLFYDYDEKKAAYIRTADELEKILNGDINIAYDFDKEQINKSKRIHFRTFIFSGFIWLNSHSRFLFNILPLKDQWKDIVKTKTELYQNGRVTEKHVLEYMKTHG